MTDYNIYDYMCIYGDICIHKPSVIVQWTWTTFVECALNALRMFSIRKKKWKVVNEWQCTDKLKPVERLNVECTLLILKGCNLKYATRQLQSLKSLLAAEHNYVIRNFHSSTQQNEQLIKEKRANKRRKLWKTFYNDAKSILVDVDCDQLQPFIWIIFECPRFTARIYLWRNKMRILKHAKEIFRLSVFFIGIFFSLTNKYNLLISRGTFFSPLHQMRMDNKLKEN